MEKNLPSRRRDAPKHRITAAETDNSILSIDPICSSLSTIEPLEASVSSLSTCHRDADFLSNDPLHEFEPYPPDDNYYININLANPLQHSQDHGSSAYCIPNTPLLRHPGTSESGNMPQEDFATQSSEATSYLTNDFDVQFSSYSQTIDPTMDYWSTLSPLDRWENSPPEAEAACLDDILSSVKKSSMEEKSQKLRRKTQSSGVSKPRGQQSQRQTPSVAASDSARSSASSTSASSAHSLGSNNSKSFGKFYVGESTRRRRRRQQKDSSMHHLRPEQPPQRPYQCTFCTDAFKSKHDWVRHEKTLHLSLERWPCAPFGPTYEDEATSTPRCAFCGTENPPESHIREHRFWECQDKPLTLRTFYRKDHLTQHLRLVHGVEDIAARMTTWKSEVTHVNSRCGFCGDTFTQWPERNNHLAAHYRKGASMKDWKGCRGLDPAVALAVDNAMPPYLIGIESNGVDPFSASTRGCPPTAAIDSRAYGAFCPNQPKEAQPTPFEQLTEHLIRFVRRKQAQGSPITDECIQQEARGLLYGDDDPWNQTAADSPEWLRLFKEGIGLNASTPNLDPGTSNISSNAIFPLPWTADEEYHRVKNQNEMCTNGLAGEIDPWMPWAWQSPECLAEFRKFRDGSISCSTPQQTGMYSAQESSAAEADLPF
ncbi:DNA-binding domain-containing protein [Aspergillus glaucus CBS 516.65]|uniref:C2H2-type domain-containing protein n=1 Tax=Aspergillus glaucus CBS 516.65 TaxID=1160497 RepID=A0A1L9VVI8_ASPGL|nr:hypothetical protein ASPGLDRAFT_1007118 [Aspergillus glaucus CBS 516.65]OJJ87928.1 hypothetical protein ASPGLDRAFT_1007118 [Aspergillus glaucus CBS 516.65]